MRVFDRISVKPGKPTLFHVRGRQLVFCLPGNPVAALMTGRVLVAPALAALCGRAVPDWTPHALPLGGPVRRVAERDLLAPMRRERGVLVFDGWHGSGISRASRRPKVSPSSRAAQARRPPARPPTGSRSRRTVRGERGADSAGRRPARVAALRDGGRRDRVRLPALRDLAAGAGRRLAGDGLRARGAHAARRRAARMAVRRRGARLRHGVAGGDAVAQSRARRAGRRVVARRMGLGLPSRAADDARAFAAPLLWTAMEMARLNWPLSGYPWIFLGHALAASPVLVQGADLGGVLLLSFLAACVADGLRQLRAGRRAAATVAGLLLGAAAIYGVLRPGTLPEPRPGPRLATIQPAFPQVLKDSQLAWQSATSAASICRSARSRRRRCPTCSSGPRRCGRCRSATARTARSGSRPRTDIRPTGRRSRRSAWRRLFATGRTQLVLGTVWRRTIDGEIRMSNHAELYDAQGRDLADTTRRCSSRAARPCPSAAAPGRVQGHGRELDRRGGGFRDRPRPGPHPRAADGGRRAMWRHHLLRERLCGPSRESVEQGQPSSST